MALELLYVKAGRKIRSLLPGIDYVPNVLPNSFPRLAFPRS